MKSLRYALEYAALWLFMALFRILPWRMASNLGAFLVGSLAPSMAVSRKAKRNLHLAMPELGEDRLNTIIKGMWHNLGHVLGEYPHLSTIAANHTTIIDPEGWIERLRDDGKPAILIGIHSANWEVMPLALLHHHNLVMHPVYRAPNNPYVDRLLHHFRTRGGPFTPFDKSRKGMMGLSRAMASGEHIGMLVDQKYNEGVEVPFFGRPAMTSTAFIELCRRYDCPLLPGFIRRTETGDYILEITSPLDIENQDQATILTQTHDLIEQTIRTHPEQWLWLHRRWKEETL